jgi:hypothetical protein
MPRLQFPASFALHFKLGVGIVANHNWARGLSTCGQAINVPTTSLATEVEFVAAIYVLNLELKRRHLA